MSATKPKSVTPITAKRAADWLGVKPWRVVELTQTGELPSVVLNGRRFVALEDVQRIRPRPAWEAGIDVSSPDGKVGVLFRMFRTDARLSLAEVAAKVGVSPSVLGRIERGQRRLHANEDLEDRLINFYANPSASA